MIDFWLEQDEHDRIVIQQNRNPFDSTRLDALFARYCKVLISSYSLFLIRLDCFVCIEFWIFFDIS